jgi:hypothetical protein
MKKTICAICCFTVVLYIFPVTAFASDFSNKAISAFQNFRKANDEWTAAFLSGDSDLQKEKGELLTTHKDNYTNILRALPRGYCADPQMDVLREFIKTLISTSNSSEEYPTYVFAELYACDPERVIKEILSLTPEDQKIVSENLDWGFKNMTYKIESLPNYKELKEKLNDLKRMIRTHRQ